MRIESTAAPAPSTELATISAMQAIVPAEFFRPGGSGDVLSALKAEVLNQAARLDISTEAGRTAIASLAYKVARSKTALDEQGKRLVEDIKRQSGEIDAERRKVREELDALKEQVRKPLTDWEDAEKARVAGHEAALAAMSAEGDGIPVWTAPECELKILQVQTMYEQRDWEEFAKRALDVRNSALFVLTNARTVAKIKEERLREAEHQVAEARERAIKEREAAAAKAAEEAATRRAEEQALLARKAAERERWRLENERIEAEARAKQAEAQRIADAERAVRELREAEERRQREAEQAEARRLEAERRAVAEKDRLEREAREAAERAERERIAAEEKAARDAQAAEERRKADLAAAEQRRIADEQAAARRAEEAAAQARRDQEAAVARERQRIADEQQRLADETAKRERNKAHRLKIDNEALGAIVALDIPMDRAQDLLLAIRNGEIPHVKIEY